jgi:hypothetical protein
VVATTPLFPIAIGTGGVFYFSLRSSKFIPKEKGKKESASNGAV